jgi:collagenase-like PrtC family protease
MELGLKCVDCHARLVHDNLYGRQARPVMGCCVDYHTKRRLYTLQFHVVLMDMVDRARQPNEVDC